MDINQVLAPAKPILALIGTLLIGAGLLKFFGMSVPVSGGGLEIAVAGFLCKHI